MVAFTHTLGKTGLIMFITVGVFLYTYANSVKFLDWVELQTHGTREYILEKLSFLLIEVKPENITYALLFLAFGPSSLIVIVGLFTGYWKLGLFLAIIVGVIGWKIPRPIIDKFVERRIKQYQSQMVDALNLLGNGLKAGLSFNQGLGMVVDEMAPPVSQEFKRILDENSLGQPMEECLENLTKRIPLEENEMFVTAVNILKEAGGNLIDIFETIVGVIRERVRLQQKIETLTAQAKIQATIISMMPTAIFLMMLGSDKESVMRMLSHPLGITLVVLAYLINIVGYFAIKKVVQLKI